MGCLMVCYHYVHKFLLLWLLFILFIHIPSLEYDVSGTIHFLVVSYNFNFVSVIN